MNCTMKGVLITDNKSASRAIDILDLITKENRPMTLTEIGRSLDIPKSSCFDIVYTLVAKGVLEIENDALKTFRPGIKLFQMGSAVLSGMNLHSVSHPLLKKLAETTRETVYLAVEDKGEIVYLDKEESDDPIRSTLMVGSRNKMHLTGLGKALLAAYPESRVKEIMGNEPFEAKTSYTIKEYSALKADLEKVRERGYAIDDREGMEFLRCIAAPVRDYKNHAVAAISIAALDSRLPFEKIPETAALLTDTAMQISQKLGYTGKTLYF